VDDGKVLGVITRTDLLNILVGGPVIPSFLYESRDSSRYLREKNMAAVLKERLPRRVIELLKELGRVADLMGFNAYLVGGLVRDILLKRENLDVDIVIEGDGIKFAQEFAGQHEVKVRSHKKFGTVVLVFRRVKTPPPPASVSISAAPPPWRWFFQMDLYRRDFTINTLATAHPRTMERSLTISDLKGC
jgi:tRNA nucleotidyltransferase (CCA-adding enzyme)